ncbi:large proline-rich protein BAG6-like [Durio zibethinus]|uniref:Large proline-rich protein BAG6-like n=1 Tax=Durio zibethinus TaxID=66656 RepID=A0A6P6AX26_DURZI|nr:large proline-rich protein BAG6-like [Durio zibethinus]
MADQHSNEGSSSGESSDSLVELRIKTLDSQIASFLVDKNTPVSSFKERIANALGVPVGQQRLIFRGKVLKDDHLLSAYHVENGHTFHLVERQPAQSQASSDTNSGETNGNNSNRGNDANAGIPRNRVGQISHSVVLGTFNVGDQGEGGIVPELTRVIGAVLNSFGVGGQSAATGITTQSSTSAPQGNEMDGARGGGENQAGNQTQSQSFPGQLFQVGPQVIPIPLTSAPIPVPSLNSTIPDSLNTLSEFMDRMEAHSPNGYQPYTSTTNRRDQPRVVLPSDARGLPTLEALSMVMRHAEQLLSSHAIAALSHIAGRLEQERDSSEPLVREQIQTESVQVGLAMQHLGSLLLELGRTILTLRMGRSPAESSVNAGPAVYISPSGPNPIMVQPFPLQTNSLFSGSQSPSNPLTLGPVGTGNAPRHINIHIHAGTALAPVVSAVGNRTSNGEGVQGEHGNNSGSGSMRVLPVRNVIATAVPARSTSAASSAAPTDLSLSSVIAEVNSRLRNFVSNMQGENQVESGNNAGIGQSNNMVASGAGDSSVALPADVLETEEQKSQPQNAEGSNKIMESGESSKVVTGTVGFPPSSSGELLIKSEDPSGSVVRSSEENTKPVPLGLGLGGLERKRRVKQTKSSLSTGDSGTTSSSFDPNLSARMTGQQILQSLASRSSSMNRVEQDVSSCNPGVQSSRLSGAQSSDDQLDAANAVSQVLQSPALNGLLAGVSEQTGVGSPDVLGNMLQQLTQSPQIMNTVSQLAQQVDSQDIGNMFSGLGGGQGGGIDLSRMVQQMMPIVSQALSRGTSVPPPFPAVEPKSQVQHDGRKSSAADKLCDCDYQDNIQQTARRIEQSNSSGEVFQAVTENAVQVYGNGRNAEELLNELCGNQGLAKEYTEMLQQDLRRRFQDKSEDKC